MDCFHAFKTPGLAHTAYFIASQGAGILVDPRRDVGEYVDFAMDCGASISHVLQTHRQEDFVMGSAALKALGAATVAGAHSNSRYCDKQMQDGEKMTIGGLVVTCLATPGHTPESVCFALAQKDYPERAWCVFSGDTLLLGDTGRADLTAEEAGECAGQMWDAVRQKLAPLGDSCLVFPAHTAGSACAAGGLSKFDQSTIGYERLYNKAFTLSCEAFMAYKRSEALPRPPHFAQMEKANLRGGTAMPLLTAAPLSPQAFSKEAQAGVIIDTRAPETFASGHLPRSFRCEVLLLLLLLCVCSARFIERCASLWLEGLPLYASYIAPENKLVYLVLERREDLPTALLHLARIGCDTVAGVLAGGFEAWRDAGMPVERTAVITAPELAAQSPQLPVLDVRTAPEYRQGHIEGAKHLFCGEVGSHMAEVALVAKRDEPIAVICSVGNRGSLAASVLQRQGYTSVRNVVGGMEAWQRQGLPVVEGEPKANTPHPGVFRKQEDKADKMLADSVVSVPKMLESKAQSMENKATTTFKQPPLTPMPQCKTDKGRQPPKPRVPASALSSLPASADDSPSRY